MDGKPHLAAREVPAVGCEAERRRAVIGAGRAADADYRGVFHGADAVAIACGVIGNTELP